MIYYLAYTYYILTMFRAYRVYLVLSFSLTNTQILLECEKKKKTFLSRTIFYIYLFLYFTMYNNNYYYILVYFIQYSSILCCGRNKARGAAAGTTNGGEKEMTHKRTQHSSLSHTHTHTTPTTQPKGKRMPLVRMSTVPECFPPPKKNKTKKIKERRKNKNKKIRKERS